MSEIDVSEVLLSSEVAGDGFVVIRRLETVGNDGFEQQMEQRFPAYGSVQPMDSEFLRENDYDLDTKGIVVITNFRLRTTSKDAAQQSFKPDIVLDNGNQYVVKRIEDWSRYGRGFIRAECVSEDFVDQAPQ